MSVVLQVLVREWPQDVLLEEKHGTAQGSRKIIFFWRKLRARPYTCLLQSSLGSFSAAFKKLLGIPACFMPLGALKGCFPENGSFPETSRVAGNVTNKRKLY